MKVCAVFRENCQYLHVTQHSSSSISKIVCVRVCVCVCVSGYMCECVCPCVCVIYIYSICEHADSEQYTHVTYPDQKRILSVLFYSSLSYSFQTVLTIWAIFLSLPLLKCILLKKKKNVFYCPHCISF